LADSSTLKAEAVVSKMLVAVYWTAQLHSRTQFENRSYVSSLENKKPAVGLRPAGDHWSGEATRTQGFAVEEARVDVMIGDEGIQDQTAVRKERPIWMTESTIIPKDTVMVRVPTNMLKLQDVTL
jgi:hypothetical protein